MAWLLISLPAVEARAVHDRVTAMAKVLAVEEGEQRTIDQLRADVVADLLIDGEVGAHPDAARGIRATAAVPVSALALLNGDLAGQCAPAQVAGVGPADGEQ